MASRRSRNIRIYPRSPKVGDVIEIKTRRRHRMETGLRKDKKTGKPIPRNIINSLVATFDGQEVFRMKMHPAISAQPFVAFHMKLAKPGELVVTWTEDTGKSWSEKTKLPVQ